MTASGFGVKDLSTGQLDVRTVSPTANAARVSWLGVNGVNVWKMFTEEYIEELFERSAGDHFKVVPVWIEEQP